MQAGVATSGTADSFLKAAHAAHTRQGHQVTVSSLYLLLQKAFSQEADSGQDLEDGCAEHVQASPQFAFWWIILHLELTVLINVRSVRDGNFLLYVDPLSRIVSCFFALGHTGTNYARRMGG